MEIELPETPANLTVDSTQRTGAKSSRRQSTAPGASTGAKQTPSAGSVLPTEDEAEEDLPPPALSKRLSFGGALRGDGSSNRRASRGRPASEDEEDELPAAKKPATAASKQSSGKGKQPLEEEEEEYEPMQLDEPSAGAIDDDDFEQAADYDDEDDEKSLSVSARRNTRTAVRGRPSRSTVDDDAMEADDDDEVVRPSKKPAAKPAEESKPRGRGKKAAAPAAVESEEDEAPKPRSRGKKSAAAAAPTSDEEEEQSKPRGRGKRVANVQSDEEVEEAKSNARGKKATAAEEKEPEAAVKARRAVKSASSAKPAATNEDKDKSAASKLTRGSKADVAAPEKPAEKPAGKESSKPASKEKLTTQAVKENSKPAAKAANKVEASSKPTEKPGKKSAPMPPVYEETEVEDINHFDAGDDYLDDMERDIFAEPEPAPVAPPKKLPSSKVPKTTAEDDSARARKQADKDKADAAEKKAQSEKNKKRKRSPSPVRDEEVASLAATLRHEASTMNGDDYDEQVLAAARANTNAKTKAERRKSVYVPQNIASPDASSSRRSQRRTVPPVQFWKNERIEYVADAEGLPVAKTVIKKIKPPMLDEDGMPIPEDDLHTAAPASKRAKHLNDLVFCDLVNPELQGELQTQRTFQHKFCPWYRSELTSLFVLQLLRLQATGSSMVPVTSGSHTQKRRVMKLLAPWHFTCTRMRCQRH
jgi:hypothetical protein